MPLANSIYMFFAKPLWVIKEKFREDKDEAVDINASSQDIEELFTLMKNAQNESKTLLEDLDAKTDIGIKLEVIFNDVSQRYGVLMAERRMVIEGNRDYPPEGANVVLFPKTKELEEFRQQALNYVREMPDTPDDLIAIFKNGRVLDDECIPSPITEKYIVARNAVNDVLQKRGFDIKVR